MTDTKAVLRKLLTEHVGEQNAITQQQLAESTGVNPSTLRSELRRLREERQIPIANRRNGYYVIQDREELQAFVGHINEEIQSKRATIDHTVEAFQSFDPDEATVPDEDADDTPDTPTYECLRCGDAIPQTEARYPEDHDRPCCKTCFGKYLQNGKSFAEGEA